MDLNIKKREDIDPDTGRLKKEIRQNRTRLEQVADLGGIYVYLNTDLKSYEIVAGNAKEYPRTSHFGVNAWAYSTRQSAKRFLKYHSDMLDHESYKKFLQIVA